jgi:hypothetical protein
MENNIHKIKYLNTTVKIIQFLSESNNQFNKRLDFIKKLEKESVNWKEAYRLSKIWYCIKFKQCKYLPELYHKIITYDKVKLDNV